MLHSRSVMLTSRNGKRVNRRPGIPPAGDNPGTSSYSFGRGLSRSGSHVIRDLGE